MKKDPAGKCVEMTLKAMRTSSDTAKQGYLSAAQWFALAAAFAENRVKT